MKKTVWNGWQRESDRHCLPLKVNRSNYVFLQNSLFFRILLPGKFSRLLLLCVFCLFSNHASATVPSIFTGRYISGSWSVGGDKLPIRTEPIIGTSAQEVCDASGSDLFSRMISAEIEGISYFGTSPVQTDAVSGKCNVKIGNPTTGAIHNYDGNYGLIFKCPPNSYGGLTLLECICDLNFPEKAGMCVRKPSPEPFNMCKADPRGGLRVGNPIEPMTGDKIEEETDFSDQGPSPLTLRRYYRSGFGLDGGRKDDGFGRAWIFNQGAHLTLWATLSPQQVTIEFPEGYVKTFEATSSGGWFDSSNPGATLTQDSGGNWIYRSVEDDTVFKFSPSGRPLTTVARNGWATTYNYDAAGQLASVVNPFGRTLSLSYNAGGQVSSIATPDGRIITYSYDDSKRLTAVTYPDGKVRSYLYENSYFPYALTGIVDELGARYATFKYDKAGSAVSTEHANGVNRYQVVRSADPGVTYSATVIDPMGTSRSYQYATTIPNRPVVYTSSLPAGDGSRDAAMRYQAIYGSELSEYSRDFKGALVDQITWDRTRWLPTRIIRNPYADSPQTSTIGWHASFRLPTSVAENGRTTFYTYDSQGNELSRSVIDTTASPNTTRIWRWTYNTQGLPLTETAPNGAVSSFEYDSRGNKVKSTNALGHVSRYTFDNANRVVSETAPNGLVTTYTYDERDRLLTRTVGNQQTTKLTYKPFGNIESISLPNGLVFAYTYDAAHRLTGWSNNRGEQGTFTLDNMGNRIAEQIKNSSGAVAWTAVRAVTNINRVYSETVGLSDTNTFGYDANGDLAIQSNGLNQSTFYNLDELRRVTTLTNAVGDYAALEYNGLGAISTVWDFKGVRTKYMRNADGNPSNEFSNDAWIGKKYDSLGLPSQVTDNNIGQTTTIVRDALGRPTKLTFEDGKETTLRYDLAGTSIGQVSEIVDRSGTTTYTHDNFGRITSKRQALVSGLVQQIGYGYSANGQLSTVTYPNGGVLGYQYDATGRLVQLDWNGVPLISGIAWNPLGQPTAWTWAFTSASLGANRSYDPAGRLTATEFSGYAYDAAGRITGLTQQLFQPADGDPTHNTIGSANKTWAVRYDAVGRITGFDSPNDTAGFGYDANGNRKNSTRTINGQTTTRTYTLSASSNKLTGFDQNSSGASASVIYIYNSNADLLSDGLRTYAYDAEGRLSAVTTGATDASPTTRYAHNELGQRVFKTEPLYPPSQGDASDPGFLQSLMNFFTRFWQPASSEAEKLGWAYVYDEDGSLIAETGTGGANSTGSTSYIYLPTASGPKPIAAVINGQMFAVHSDHLNTPRRLTNEDGQPVWQWSYSAFGDNEPTTAANRFGASGAGTTGTTPVTFNLRYPGQYFDKESGLHYNYFRSYSPTSGRYSQSDPIGLDGGWNRFGYVDANPLKFIDPFGLDNPNMGPYGPGRNQGQGLSALQQRSAATSDFIRNYNDMRDANTIGGDKYFHCKANCEATRRGTLGEATACSISDTREWTDQNIKGDPASASRADQAANAIGRSGALSSSQSCSAVCAPFRPTGLPPQY